MAWEWDNDVLSQPSILRKQQPNAWLNEGERELLTDQSSLSSLCSTDMTVSPFCFGSARSTGNLCEGQERSPEHKYAASSEASKPTGEQQVVVGEADGGEARHVSRDSLICLELGKRTYFENSITGCSGISPTPVPPKKPRASSSAGQTRRCQVEGCKADLISAKEYHRRHKVCEIHSKASAVIVAGQERRFCQQCSRFQVLSEFDEGKRSCRRRLAGHNERRRKPQADPLGLSRISSFQECALGHFMIQSQSFLHTPWISNTSPSSKNSEELKSLDGKVSWLGMKSEDQSGLSYLIQGPQIENESFLSGSQQTDDRLPFLLLQSPKEYLPMSNDEASKQVLPYLQRCTDIDHNLTISSSSGTSAVSIYEPGTPYLSLSRVPDSGRALSLLSSQPPWAYFPRPFSLDASTRSNVLADQWICEDPLAVQFMQGQQHCDVRAGQLLSSLSQNVSLSTGISSGNDSLAKGSIVSEGFRISSKNSLLHDPELRASHGNQDGDKRATIDLMHLPAFSRDPNLQESSHTFQLEGHQFGELEAFQSYGSPIFDSDQ